MKKTDIAMIILIATVSVMIAFFATKAILGDAVSDPVKVKKVDAIKSSVEDPSERIFHEGAINPSVEVQIEPRSE